MLVLGPRAAVQADDPNRRPLDDLLTCNLLNDLGEQENEAPFSSCNLHSVADLYYRKCKDREQLEVVVQDFYRGEAGSTTDFHHDLARLPFKLCISASPDSLMLNAFEQVGKSPQKGYYSFRHPSSLKLASPAPEKPLVYYLFGHYDDPSSLVLTEGDVIDFLVAIIRLNPPVPDQVRSILKDPSSSFLFIGFGFHRWYLRVLLQVMDVYGHRSKAIAFEDVQFFDHPDHEQTVGFFSGDRLIQFRQLHWKQFPQQLLEAYDASVTPALTAGAAVRQVIPADAPKAFVSYASEDFAAVEALKEKLENKGIRIWQDKQDLRAGDDWYRVLLDVIKNRVNYVVVVQTTTMTTAIEGVFHREIAAAREKQDEMGEVDGQKLRFLIPVQIGDCTLLSSLKNLHVIDVSEPSGVDKLAASILEDWSRRTTLKSRGRGGT